MVATKCSLHRTCCKIVARILRRVFERKTEDVLGEDRFGFRRGERNRYAAEMLRIM
jgi:hypothetical protein